MRRGAAWMAAGSARRWDIPTAQFRPQREYAVPVAFQADMEKRVAAVLMSRPQDCFAVTSGYNTDDPEDAWKVQNPLYLSLFGSDFVPGTERTAHVRLAITTLDDAHDAAVGALPAVSRGDGIVQ